MESESQALSKIQAVNEGIRKQIDDFANKFGSRDHLKSIQQPEFSSEGDSSLVETNIAISGEEQNK